MSKYCDTITFVGWKLKQFKEAMSRLKFSWFAMSAFTLYPKLHWGCNKKDKTTTVAILSSLAGACLPEDRYRQHDSITTVKHAVWELYRCAAEIKTKAEFEDGRGPTHEYWILM